MRLANAHQTRVGTQLDDHFTHLADRAGRGAYWLWKRNGQEVCVESGDFHRNLSRGSTLLSCQTPLAHCALDHVWHSRAMRGASKVTLLAHPAFVDGVRDGVNQRLSPRHLPACATHDRCSPSSMSPARYTTGPVNSPREDTSLSMSDACFII